MMVDPCTAHRSHRVIMKLSENSCRCGGTSCPDSISWRLDTKESDRPSDAGNNPMFFLQIPVNMLSVCACCCRIHSGKISFYNKTEICSCICINDKLQKNKFLCLRSCFFYCSSPGAPGSNLLHITRFTALVSLLSSLKGCDGNFILRS